MYSLKKFLLSIFLIASINSFGQSGCTDYQANNFDPWAYINDGSCIYPFTSLPLNFKCYIDSLELNETSGIANQNQNFWTHVDDANTAIYRIDTLSDSIFQRVTINNSTNIDWEDITYGDNYIYVGDVGNNDGNRTNQCFYKILKTDITTSSIAVNAGKINFSYADQLDFTINHNHNFYDCEAFFYMNDSIHIFTKGWVNRWTKHYVIPDDTGTHIAQLVDSFNVSSLITSAAIQGDSLIVLLGLNFTGGNNCYVWMFSNFEGSDFFSGNKRRFSIGSSFTTGQTEGICFSDTNKGFITNERNLFGSLYIPAQLREFDLNSYLTPPPPAPIISQLADTIIKNLKACSDTSSATFMIKNITVNDGQNLYFTIDSLATWQYATPPSGSIAAGDSVMITINFNSDTMSSGEYFSNITIHSNDFTNPDQMVSCTLIVDSNPCMGFTYTSDTCIGLLNFASSSINTPTSYYWDFGDGDSSSLASPSHSYDTSGIYVAILVGCNSAGCDTIIQNINVIYSGPKTTNCYPVTQSYCCGTGITHFQIFDLLGDVINNNSNDAVVSYEDFTCMNLAPMFSNHTYNLICTTSTSVIEYLKMWIDINNDGVLDSISEEIFSDLDSVNLVHTGTIIVPDLPGIVYGHPLRLRVASDFQQVPQPCLNPQSGQHEDYSVILNSSVAVNDIFAESFLKIYPNPFTRYTNIDYELIHASKLKLAVYDLLGNKITSLVDSPLQPPGKYHFRFGENRAGFYIVKLSTDDKVFVKRIMKTF